MQKINIIKLFFILTLNIFSFSCFLNPSITFAEQVNLIATYNPFPTKPSNDVFVVDNANLLNAETKEKLLKQSNSLIEKYNSQLIIVTVNSFGNLSVNEYADKLFEKWEIGNENANRGILILVEKESNNSYVKIGDGLKDVISEEKANKIQKIMFASFRRNLYDVGIKKAHDLLTSEIYSESARKKDIKKEEELFNGSKVIPIGIITILALSMLLYLTFKIKRTTENFLSE